MRKEAECFSLTSASITAALSAILAVLLVATAAAQSEEEEILVEEELVPEDYAGVTPDSPIYVFDKIVDDVQLALAKGDDKTKKALEIKEERIAEAAVMVNKKKPDQAQSALELATKAAELAQKDLAPDLEKETNEKVRRAAKLLSGLQEKLPDQGWEGVEKALDAQLSEEEKVRVALLVSKSRLSYCDAIAKEDFDVMKQDELCQVEKAPQWLKERVEGEFKSREENARGLIIGTISTCVVDPKKCDCSQIPVGKHSQTCEVKKALAIRCEYENDESACSELASEKLEDFLPDFVGEEGKQTLLAHLRQKEEQMFQKFKPPECKDTTTPQECFKIMMQLYGEPPECKGLSDDECLELVKNKKPEEFSDFPAECKEAGIKTPIECAEHMFSKYGKPPQCEGLDTKECMKMLRQERPDAANFALPPECQDAGAKEPRQCFDIMTAKYGSPPECKGLDADACFKEMMKRGPGGAGGEMMGQEPPECKEKGLKGKDCFLAMMELYGRPPECEGVSTDECFQKMAKDGPRGASGNCVGLSPEECRAKLQEQHGLPLECAENPDRCTEAFAGRGVPGGLPAECAGLERGQCEATMREKYGSHGPGPGGMPPGEVGFGEEGRRKFEQGGFGEGFKNECEGLAREECEHKMFEKFAPPECKGTTMEDCKRGMSERFENERQKRGEEGGGFGGGEGRGSSGIPTECQGLSEDECRSRFFEDKGQGDIRGEGERREMPPGFEGEHGEGSGVPFTREFQREGGEAGKGVQPSGFPAERSGPGPQRTERAPLGEPIRGEQKQPYPTGQYPQKDYPQSQPTSSQQPASGSEAYPGGDYQRSYEKSSSGDGSYPSSSYPGGGAPSDGGSSSGGSYSGSGEGGTSSGTSGGGGGDTGSGAQAITGQVIKALKWIGGR